MEQFNLKMWREAHGYTKVRLAEVLGLSRWTIARMEDDSLLYDDRPTPRYIELACKALDHD